MITSTLEHNMAGSVGYQTGLHTNKLQIHTQTVYIIYTVNIILNN